MLHQCKLTFGQEAFRPLGKLLSYANDLLVFDRRYLERIFRCWAQTRNHNLARLKSKTKSKLE